MGECRFRGRDDSHRGLFERRRAGPFRGCPQWRWDNASTTQTSSLFRRGDLLFRSAIRRGCGRRRAGSQKSEARPRRPAWRHAGCFLRILPRSCGLGAAGAARAVVFRGRALLQLSGVRSHGRRARVDGLHCARALRPAPVAGRPDFLEQIARRTPARSTDREGHSHRRRGRRLHSVLVGSHRWLLENLSLPADNRAPPRCTPFPARRK